MTMQKLRDALTVTRKSGNADRVETLSVVLGELQLKDKRLLVDEENVIKFLAGMKKTALENGEKYPPLKEQNDKLAAVISEFLPQPATKEEIKEWITNNVDFTQLKTKMQAIGLASKYFGARTTGNVIKRILEDNF